MSDRLDQYDRRVRRRQALIGLGVVALILLTGALHLVGVLPPG